MKKITALIPLMMLFIFLSCKEDDKLTNLENEINDLKNQLDSSTVAKHKDSLNFLLSLSELEYRKYKDSLRRADSLAFGSGTLPFTYNILVYDGSTTSVLNTYSGSRTEAFDAEVTVSVSQYGETRSVATTDGLASFDDIGRGIVKVSVSAPGYTTLQLSFETMVDPHDLDLIPTLGLDSIGCGCQDFWDFVKTGNIGHDVAIFATEGELASTLSGRAFVETDLTNSTREVVPEGTVLTAAIDVDNFTFQEEFILYRNKQLFTDNILSFGYDPNFTATVDDEGDFTFVLAGAANEMGLPYHFDYSDFLADQIVFDETVGEVTAVTGQTIFGPEVDYTIVPTVSNAATVSFAAGSGATAILDTQGNGSIVDIDVESVGQEFQGTPRVFIEEPPAGGTQATATATEANGRITAVTIDEAGSGYVGAPGVVVTEGDSATAEVTGLISDGENGGVALVQVQQGGAGYGVAPNVLFYSGTLPGTFAGDSAAIANFEQINSDMPTAAATLNTNNGSVASIAVGNDGGSDLSANPNVLITAGFGATAEVTGVNADGTITGINPLTPGLYYTEVVSVSGGTGTVEASFTVTTDANGAIQTINIANGGLGYTDGDVLVLNGGFTTQATAIAVSEGLSVESYQITDPGHQYPDGMYYTNPPLIVFSAPDYTGAGSARATGTAVLGADGRLIGITITDIGSGYTGFPDIEIVSGNSVSAVAEIEPFVITEVDVTAGGSGYIAAPRVEIFDADGVGSGASATAVINSAGVVTSIVLDDPGSNYSDPQVVIVDPGNSYDPTDGSVHVNIAEAEVEVIDGEITAITITAVGDNYPDGTNVVLSATRGTGFDGVAVVAGGQITGVTLNNGGEDYIGGNLPEVTENFEGVEDEDEYYAKTSITRVRDVYYGTGARRNGIVD